MPRERKISFKNDYSEGAHPEILKILSESNHNQEPGYGSDQLSEQSKVFIRQEINKPNAKIYYVSGGTQANILVISHLLKPYESVIAADSGHIHVHETGAIEYTGHKINTVPHENGKLTIDGIKNLLSIHTDEHMVKPSLVYISQCTELGTVYSLSELTVIADFCKLNSLKLYIDGARMAVALANTENRIELNDIANLADVFYLGATKNGGLLGEAIVFPNPDLANGFEYALKQKGALMAKGRILGAQFYALFKDNLYLKLAEYANNQAKEIAKAFMKKGVNFHTAVQTNQIFPILSHEAIEQLRKNFDFYTWEKLDGDFAVVRIVTSWDTKKTDVNFLIQEIEKIGK